ncbi:hypothetical protein MLD38_031909 [Melastoma candidum]|uniref:Uncharacterized protein n=1 Tax=Melastoma candidum TaxID=119954 RepID=A0ACB9MR58_9MYRT|nr:hypothetical protein MLD38_031909 [Melastoma candidum]
MMRLRKNVRDVDDEDGGGVTGSPDPADPDWKCGSFSPMRLMGVVVASLMLSSVLFSVSVVLRDFPTDGLLADGASLMSVEPRKSTSLNPEEVEEEEGKKKDVLLGGLLAGGFDDSSCASRYQSALLRKVSNHKPSDYLISRLRRYESLHKRCGPRSEAFRSVLEVLRSGRAEEVSECKYVVWISFSGLGNRILTLASAFLYALLTNRVLLVDPGADVPDLFCEPFPGASWFLPSDFPLKDRFHAFDLNHPQSYGNMEKTEAVPPFVYLHLVHNYGDRDKLFFCDEDQAFLKNVPWLILKTDNYFVPSLFLMQSFEEELDRLFPEKETVFHFLGRYLFHPTNSVWGLIRRYYYAYLARADERIGIQVRVFDEGAGPFKHVLDQIMSCVLKENLLPGIHEEGSLSTQSSPAKSKAVLVTSLSSGYFEQLRDIYWENPAVTGEVVSVVQPSHEEFQQTEKQMHNRKAWAEMYLLSLTEVLVTSSWSTFGYVAQGLGGLKPWILYKPENRTTPDPPCERAMSMEPCFHAPPFYDCKAKRGIDTGLLVPHVRHCEDMSWGLKLVHGEDRAASQ